MKENVLITGVDGFKGAHLTKKLLEKYNVVGLMHDHRPITTLTLLGLDNKITKIYGDICDRDLIKRILADYNIKRVFHLAAQAIVSVALKDPLTTFKVNCLGTATLLDACRDLNLTSINVISTDKTYGEGMERKETDVLDSRGIYETSKAAMDYIGRSFFYVYGLPVIVTRACNTYGEYDLNKRIVPNTILALKSNEQPIIFRGEKSIREYVYVDDVSDAYITLSEHINRTKGEIFNVGSGSVISQEDLVKKIIEISGKRVEPKYLEKSKDLFEIFQQTVNTEKIRNMIGWKPKFDLNMGLKRTWDNWRII
jgi:CDP-glucose 4,6-dehydratase